MPAWSLDVRTIERSECLYEVSREREANSKQANHDEANAASRCTASADAHAGM